MFGKKLLGNTRVPHNKNTADIESRRFTPNEVLLPATQHIGAPAVPVVSVNDAVKVGDKVMEASGFVSSPIFSSVSGTVKRIETSLRPDGRTVMAIRIESDGLFEKADVTPPTVTDLDSLVLAVRESGIVGLGGAGFPTAVKLAGAKSGKITTLILNGAECEPYITSDTRTMIEHSDLIGQGVDTLLKFIPSIQHVYIGIEKNKPDCIASMREAFRDNEKVEVKPLPSLYPQGAEKVLIYNTSGITVEEGKLPADHGVLVMNVSTVAEMTKFLESGMPLVERTLTVDGSAVDTPENITAPIGTPIGDILKFVGVEEEKIGKILYGGPMMGVAVCSADEPILKTTNAITVLTEKEARRTEPTACIHCGRCVAACPIHLNPTAFAKALNLNTKEERAERLQNEKVLLCMECGCCSFVCPAYSRLAKAQVREFLDHSAKLKN